MADATKQESIKVALIAADGDSARLLRDMLDGLDCMTVYDAPAVEFDPITLASSGANVVIVDLTPDAEVDGIYDLLDDQRYRVIFNEAAVTSRLSGWEHARWARHLAAKILDRPAVVDPPRPNSSAAVAASAPTGAKGFKRSVRGPVDVSTTSDNAEGLVAELGIDDWLSEVMQAKDPTSSFVLAQPGISSDARQRATDKVPDLTSEVVAEEASPKAVRNSELDALMASAIETLGDVDEVKLPSVKPAAEERFDWRIEDVIRDIDEWLPPSVPAGDVRGGAMGGDARLWSPVKTTRADTSSADNDDSASEPTEPTSVALDLQLEPLSENEQWAPRISTAAPTPSEAVKRAPPFAPAMPSKTDQVAAIPATGFSASQPLELTPLEDSAASPLYAARSLASDQEMRIDVVAETGAPSRVIVLCASVGGPEAIRELLGALPSNFSALFLVVQQVGEEFLDLLSQQLRRATTLRVRGAEIGDQLRDGDVVPVSPRQRLLVDRSGRVVANERIEAGKAAPINQLLRDVSDKFESDCIVIVLSGIASDLADGCRYLAGRGGRVYAQAASSCVASAMVEQVQQAGVVSFQGTPVELASRLLADHS